MDWDREKRRGRIFWGVLCFFIGSCWFAYDEGSYFFLGRETMARITETRLMSRTARSRTTIYKEIDFVFTESNGTQRTGTYSQKEDWQPPPSGQVNIVYTPGSNGKSRFAGSVNWLGLAFFFVMASIVALFFLRIWLEAIRETAPPPKRQKRRRIE